MSWSDTLEVFILKCIQGNEFCIDALNIQTWCDELIIIVF